jgi:hypothetical protein
VLTTSLTSQGEWDQAKFERLLTDWIAVCNQPFDEVEKPEFRAVLEYTHLFSSTPLKIPGQTTIKKRIMKLGEDTVKATRKMFEVMSLLK